MKLRDYAKRNNIGYQAAWLHFKAGKIPGAYKRPTGGIWVPDPDGDGVRTKTVVYARVSSSENRDNLETQAQRASDFCAARGWVVSQVVKECASGMNDERPKLMKLLKDESVHRIVVEHKDRLTRFGFNYIASLFGGEIVVMNEVAPDNGEDLMEDFTSLVTSFCARIYGKRRTHKHTQQLIEELGSEDK